MSKATSKALLAKTPIRIQAVLVARIFLLLVLPVGATWTPHFRNILRSPYVPPNVRCNNITITLTGGANVPDGDTAQSEPGDSTVAADTSDTESTAPTKTGPAFVNRDGWNRKVMHSLAQQMALVRAKATKPVVHSLKQFEKHSTRILAAVGPAAIALLGPKQENGMSLSISVRTCALGNLCWLLCLSLLHLRWLRTRHRLTCCSHAIPLFQQPHLLQAQSPHHTPQQPRHHVVDTQRSISHLARVRRMAGAT